VIIVDRVRCALHCVPVFEMAAPYGYVPRLADVGE